MIENQSFLNWSREYAKSIKGILFAIAGAASTIYGLAVALNIFELDRDKHMSVLYGSQALVILIIFAILAFGHRPMRVAQYKRGSRAVDQFCRWWPALWFTWLLLFFVLTIFEILSLKTGVRGNHEMPETIERLFIVGLHFINNSATLVLLMLFHILAEPSLPDPKLPVDRLLMTDPDLRPTRQIGDVRIAKFLFWAGLLIAFLILETWLVLDSANPASLISVFGIAFGVFAASATALVVGQLDNKLLGVPLPAIALLFVYAGIQPSFNFLFAPITDPIILTTREVIVVIALLSKVTFFGVVQWLIRSNRLMYYMVEHYSVHYSVDANRSKFLSALDNGR